MARDKELNIKFKLTSDTTGAKAVSNEVDGISNSLNTAESQADAFYRRLSNTAVVVGSLVAIKETLGSAASNGFEYNKTIEKLTNSLTTMYAVTSSNISSTGRLLDIEEKQQLARVEALETVKELERINTRTPHTLSQTVEIYNAMLPSMRKAGVANKDLFDITEKLSIATKGIDFNQVLAGVDGLASGTVLANSDLGRFLNSLGLTNEALKNTDDIVGLINEKLKDVKAIEDYDSIVSNLTNEYNKLTAAMTSDAFEASKDLMKSSTLVLQELNDNIPQLQDTLMTIGQIGGSVLTAVVALKAYNSSIKIYNIMTADAAKITSVYGNSVAQSTRRVSTATLVTRTFSKVLRATPFGIVTTLVYGLSEAFIDNSSKAETLENAYSGVSLKLEDLTKGQLNYKKSLIETELIQARLDLANARADASSKGIFETNKEYLEDKAFADEMYIKFKNLTKASREVKEALANIGKESKKNKEGLNSSSKDARDNAEIIKAIGTEKQKFMLQLEEDITRFRKINGITEKELNDYRARETKAFNEKIEKQSKKALKTQQEDLYTSSSSWKTYFETVKDYEKAWLIKRGELRQEYIDLNDDEFTAVEKLEKNNYFDKKRKVELELKFKDIDETSNEMLSLLDSQQELISNTNNWNNSLQGVAGSINDIGQAFSKMSSDNISMQKAEIKLNTAYEKDRLKYANDQEKLKKVELKYSQDLTNIKQKSFSNELNAYGQLAGAMQNLFDKGSDEAKAMQLVQAGLATYNAVNAVLTQGQGDPYTAPFRMAAMAASVAGLLVNIGQTLGFNEMKVTESKDALTLMEENKGIGSVLGDATAASESVMKSLDILEDYAQPQFETLQSMNAYLQSIDAKMGGLSSLLIRGEQFAFGAGANTFSSSKQNLKLNDRLAVGIMTGGVGLILNELKIPLISDITGFLGNTLNSVLGGLFGKTSVSQRLHDSGLYFSPQSIKDAIAEINGQSYQTIATTVTKKSWFKKSSHTSYRSYYQDLTKETERQFESILSGLYNTVLTSSDALDTIKTNVEDELDDFVVSIGKISLKGKSGEKIQEQLTNIFSEIGDDLVKEAFPKLQEFQKVGEGLFETLTRVSTGMEVAEFYINRLGNSYEDIKYTNIKDKTVDVAIAVLTQSIEKYEQATYGLSNGVLQIVKSFSGSASELYENYVTLEQIRLKLKYSNQDAANLGSDFIKGAGSIDNLNDALSNYFENYLSLVERNAYQTELLKNEFDKLGLELPVSSEEFRNLVEGIDTSTAAGAELYGRVIILSESFASLSSSLEKAKESSEEFISSSTEQLNSLVESNTTAFIKGLNSVGDLANSLSKNALSTIYKLNSSTLSTTDKLKSFNNLRDEFDTYFTNGVLKAGLDTNEVSEKYNKILDLASSIGNDDAGLISSITDVLDGNIADFTKTEDVVKVNIVDGLAELINDGLLTNENLASMKDLTQAQKDAVLSVANNTSYVSTSQNQKSLEEFARLQLEALRKSNEQETESLSSKTLQYGDIVGLKERIDLAKLFGVDYSEIETFISDIQALDVSKNKKESLSGLINYKGNGSTSYDEVKLNQVKSLGDYLNSDITTALDDIEKEISFNKELKTYQTKLADASLIFENEKAESDAALNSFNSVSIQKTGSYYERPENFESGVAFRKGGYITYNENTALNNNRYAAYLREFSEARTAYLNLQKAQEELSIFETAGYKLGGFTPDIGIDKITGVVHGGEYVAPHYQVMQYPELFRHLDNERTGYKNGGFVDFAMPSNNTNFKEFLTELKEINRRLERMERIDTAHANVSRRMKNEVEMKMNNIINKIGA